MVSLQVELSGAVSSQYLTALLMAAPLATGKEGITIRIRDELVSQPYVDMTVHLMERFGIQVLSPALWHGRELSLSVPRLLCVQCVTCHQPARAYRASAPER